MASDGRGVAYGLWEYINRFLYERRLPQKWLVETSKISAVTINRLREAEKPPKPETVHTLARVLGEVLVKEGKLDPGHVEKFRDELAVMAGVLPTPPADEFVDARQVILNDPRLSDRGRQALLTTYEALVAEEERRRETLRRRGRSDDEQLAI